MQFPTHWIVFAKPYVTCYAFPPSMTLEKQAGAPRSDGMQLCSGISDLLDSVNLGIHGMTASEVQLGKRRAVLLPKLDICKLSFCCERNYIDLPYR